jgi:hypothetical protein
MDYARFNYVAQPEDNISPVGLYPRIGDYDKWAIEWGYKRYLDAKSADEEKVILSQLTTDRLQGNKRLWFGTESNPEDPRSQSEDIGDNAMKSGAYGIKNLQRIVPNLAAWTKVANEDYSHLEQIYYEVVGQYGRYMGHVAKNIGGIMETPKMVEQQGAVFDYTPKSVQKEAMAFLDKQVLSTPTWLINNDIFNKIGGNPVSTIGLRQENVLSSLLSTTRLGRIMQTEAALGANAYSLSEMMTDLQKMIWNELATRKPIDVYRRNLQKAYIERLGAIVSPAAPASSPFGGIVFSFGPSIDVKKTDIMSVAKGSLRSLKAEVAAAIPTATDKMSRYHLQDVLDRINKILDPK